MPLTVFHLYWCMLCTCRICPFIFQEVEKTRYIMHNRAASHFILPPHSPATSSHEDQPNIHQRSLCFCLLLTRESPRHLEMHAPLQRAVFDIASRRDWSQHWHKGRRNGKILPLSPLIMGTSNHQGRIQQELDTWPQASSKNAGICAWYGISWQR